jgi:hypothetical protein
LCPTTKLTAKQQQQQQQQQLKICLSGQIVQLVYGWYMVVVMGQQGV